jgi:hypothetical protein
MSNIEWYVAYGLEIKYFTSKREAKKFHKATPGSRLCYY